ncbi:glycerophosphodiester phosphodiesterase domain-containing protein 4 isoform X3 [Heterocephalus glaber]|uniref:Glycerophosphodiester phosphodiesterase domain-containing protein 4 isoform X3 n=1 Tax=Heterocephalus glaber TaxID=10181 RepID=A0AAX6S5F6_HETGA|nr:glycerophosphodiester phosphodiesterase domain-containing protein 4 isoform X3 [Heterocephalus glaber]
MPRKVNRIESRRKEEENRNPQIAHIFNYKRYITFLTGCYSCHWKFRRWEKTKLGSCCCTRREQCFCVFLAVAFVFSVIMLFTWIETSNEYFGFDCVLLPCHPALQIMDRNLYKLVVFLVTGAWFFWSILMLSLFGILTVYTSLLLILGVLLLWERIELYLHTCHKILIVLMILVHIFLMVILFKFWNERWLVVGLSLKIFAPYVHLSCIILMVIISWPLTFYVVHLEGKTLQLAVGLPFFLILICLYAMPLGIYSPCIQEKEELGPKPAFFAHRGSPMAGPENTMMAFEKAVEEGASGLETDVHISFDNVPYLMHDYDLRRTTNIREVMPEAAYSHPSSFNWTTLSTLNAGEWFVRPETRPFFNMKRLSQADKKRARNQSIPRLADLLKIAKKEKKIVIFDLFGPPQKHPLRHTFVHQVVSVILASKIEQNLIFWLPGHDRQYVRFMAPGFQHVGRLVSVEHLTKENISIINVDYKRLFYKGLRDYQAANIYINLYIVNEPWIFSLAWCSRINSVTTDNIPVLSQLTHPHFFMTPRYYLSIWLLLDIVSAIFIAAIFCFHWWREVKEEKLLEASRIFRDSQSLSLSVEQSESQEASHLPKKSPPRVGESPWTPALPGSRRKLSHTSHFEEHLKKKPGSIKITQNTVGPLMPTTDFEDSQVPTNWGPAGEAAPQSTLLTTKADELTVPFTEAPYPEIHPKTPVLEPAKESNPSDIPL